MPDQVPDRTKTARSNELLAVERMQSKEFRRKYIGKRVQVLLEENKEIEGKRYRIGHTNNYVKVALPLEQEAKEEATNVLVEPLLTSYLTDELMLGDVSCVQKT